MPEMTGSDLNNQTERSVSDLQENVDLEELAEELVRLLIRELQIEDERTGNI